MMHIENLRNELHKQGIDIEDVTVVKNGIKCRGFKVLTDTEGTVCPVVYFSEEDTVTEISERILAVCAARPQFDAEKLMDWDYVRGHVFLGVQRRDAESDICRREYLNLDIILRIYVDIDHLADKIGTIKVSEALVKALGISEDDIWEAAISNSRDKYQIITHSQAMGMDCGHTDYMYVANSLFLTDAASVICYAELFRSFCQEKNLKSVYILPSSTQEMIVIPEDTGSGMNALELADLVLNVNESQVDPLIQLDPCCYRYSADTDTIEIAAYA